MSWGAVPIPAKGLTGPGYDGHTFWDTETFVLPVVTLTIPHAATDARQRSASILDQTRERARLLGRRGVAFPWRTIHGEESSGYWPASTAAFHIHADIAYSATQYIEATEDRAFEQEVGLELLVAKLLVCAAKRVPSTEKVFSDCDGVQAMLP